MSTGLKFNGTDIDTATSLVKLVDVVVSGVKREATVHAHPIAPGSEFVRMRYGTRTVTITFAVVDETRSTRQAALDAITKWALSDTPKELYTPHYSDRYLTAICTTLPDPSYRQWWEGKLKLVFTCYDPFWYAATAKTSACGTAFTPNGNVPPRIAITNTFASSASNVAYSDGTHTATFSTIPAGDLLINLDDQTAAVGGTSIMQYYAFGGSWPVAKMGQQTITGTGTVRYRERWA